jgi:hypothetical protein
MMSIEDVMTMNRKRQADRNSTSGSTAFASVELSDFIERTDDSAAQRDFLDETIAVWQPYVSHPLTCEDAREIAHNVVGFFSILREWAEEERRAAVLASPPPGDAEPNRK